MIFLLDNTVLSNFALIEEPNLLQEILGKNAATTSQVMDEFLTGVKKGRVPATNWEWLSILELSEPEQPLYEQLLQQLNAGEASCLAIATQRQGRILTDDRDARKLAAQFRIPVSGTLGLLVYLVEEKQLTPVKANKLLQEMIGHGYRSPVDHIDQLLK